jgi:uncharacterized membrane protein
MSGIAGLSIPDSSPIVSVVAATSAGMLIFLALFAWMTPTLTRPDLFFAVTVRAWYRATPDARSIVWRYRLWVALHLLIALGLLFAALRIRPASPNTLLVASLVAMAWQQAGWFAAFQGARRRAMPHATPPTTWREADLTPRSARLPGGWPCQALPFAALAGAALYLRSRWDSLPERFPVHWGFDGRPNGWSTRSLTGVFGPLLITALVAAAMALLAGWQLRSVRQIRAGGVAGAAERHQHQAILWALLGVEYLLTLTSIWASLLPLRAGAPNGQPAGAPEIVPLLVLSVAVLLAVLLILAHFGQGGARLAGAAAAIEAEPPAAGPIGDRSPDSCWKGGVFYYNPEDPAVWVEKRFGIGYTLNFGRAAAWVFLILILLLPLALAVAALRAAH